MVLGFCPLFVRDESCDVFLVHIGNHSTLAQVALALSGFTGQDVTCKSVAAFDAAGSGLSEPLGSATIGLDFRHAFLLLLNN